MKKYKNKSIIKLNDLLNKIQKDLLKSIYYIIILNKHQILYESIGNAKID